MSRLGICSTHGMSPRRAPCLLAVLILLLACPSPSASGATSVRDAETGVAIHYEIPTDGLSPIWSSMQITVENRVDTREIQFQTETVSDTYGSPDLAGVSRLTRTIEPGIHRVELPVLRVADWAQGRLTVRVDGDVRPSLGTTWSASYLGPYGLLVIGEKPVENMLLPTSHVESVVLDVRPEMASRFWQTYAGLPAVVVVDGAATARLDADQRRAIALWVRYAGGTLWIRGPDARTVASRMGVCSSGATHPLETTRGARADILPCLTGQVILGEARGWTALRVTEMPPIMASVAFHGHLFGMPGIPFSDTKEGVVRTLDILLIALHKVPLSGYLVLSVALALIIGPVNYWWLRRRGSPVLFFATTPVIALAGMAALGVYSVASQGLTTKIRERALLLHDLSSHRGTVYLARAIRAGRALDTPPAFPVDTAVIPFGSRTLSLVPARCVTDWTGAQRLESGYITAREPRGLMAMAPIPVRMAVRVTRDPDGVLWVTNGLPTRIDSVFVRASGLREDHAPGPGMDASYYQAVDIPSGGRKPLTPTVEGDETRLPQSLFVDLSRLDWQAIARCDGLPNLPTGGVTGHVDDGAYLYVSAWPTPASGLERGAEQTREVRP